MKNAHSTISINKLRFWVLYLLLFYLQHNKEELTALQDHQPDQVRGSGTHSSVKFEFNVNNLAELMGWHEEQVFNTLLPPL